MVKHGPRHSAKGKTHAWVSKDKKGKFTKWTNKKRSLASDTHRKGKTQTRPVMGGQGDYKPRKKKSFFDKL